MDRIDFVQNGNLEIYRAVNREVFNESGCLFVDNEIPTKLLNGVIGGAIESKEVVDKVEAYFKKLKRPHCWIVETTQEPAFLKEALREYGLTGQGEFPGFAIDLSKLKGYKPPEELILKAVTNDEEMKIWGHVVGKVFGFSEEASKIYSNLLRKAGYGGAFTHISGIKDGKVVSTGSVLSSEKGAYIYNITTVEKERGKGYAQSVTQALLEIAKQQGTLRAALISSPMAVKVYQNLGFEKICHFHFYI